MQTILSLPSPSDWISVKLPIIDVSSCTLAMFHPTEITVPHARSKSIAGRADFALSSVAPDMGEGEVGSSELTSAFNQEDTDILANFFPNLCARAVEHIIRLILELKKGGDTLGGSP